MSDSGFPADPTRSRVLMLAHSHAFGTFRVGSHHYARTLAARGVDVVHLSTPLSQAHIVTGRVSRLDEMRVPRGPHIDEHGVTHLIPRTLLPVPLGRFSVDYELRRQGIDTRFDVVLIDQPLLWDSSVRDLSPTLVYRPTDLYPDGLKSRRQRTILAMADAVVATSAEVLDRLGRLDVPTLVLENGVDAEAYVIADPIPTPRPDVCVYVGALDSRFDWAQIDRWAHAHPAIRFEIAGPVVPSTTRRPNVVHRGPIRYEDLPDLLRSARVGLIPLSDDPLNAGRSPMKLNEYLAAGLTVVARTTPLLRTDLDAGIYTYAAPDGADAALAAALAHPSPNTAGRDRAFGASWTVKTDALCRFLRLD